MKPSRKLLFVISLGLLLFYSFASVAFAAEMTKRQKKLHAESLTQGPLYDDSKLAAYVSEVGHKALAQSPHADRQYFFFVLDTHQIQAFTPGSGLIYISRGLLSMIRTEGQLLGVLGHEIGHNVGNHLGRLKAKDRNSRIISTAASILARDGNLGDAIRAYDEVKISSFGRELELEADQLGAEYVYKANYDPEQMLEMLGILKDQELFQKQSGEGAGTYHGLYTTHPRNDKRLQKVIRQAGELPPGEALVGRDSYRIAVEGMVFGQNRRDNAPKGFDRYNNKTLGITFLYPEGWSRVIKGAKIILKDADKTVQLKISIEKNANKNQSTEQALKSQYPADLTDLEAFTPTTERDDGTLGRHLTQRVALSNIARNTFNFEGIARNNQLTADQDKTMVEIIRSFRRLAPQDEVIESIRRIRYERLEPGDTFASISKRLGKVASEDELRLLNGFYPKGEPEPGRWIKVLEKENIE
ncbi:MAG: M48 family metalloprotease [Acidiferrobacterales bacterium]|nr:M48 family metalloprotease [Acidiferrobacterales bacterium]